MRTSLIIAFLGIILSAQHGSSRPQQQLTVWRQILARNLESTPFRIGLGMNQFGNRLFSNIAKSETGNVVLSPFSLHTALSMTFFGSPERSETHLELSQLLGMAPQFYR